MHAATTEVRPASSRAELHEIWRSALITDGFDDPRESNLRCEFFHFYRKLANNGAIQRWAVTPYNTGRYNQYVSKVGDFVRAGRARLQR